MLFVQEMGGNFIFFDPFLQFPENSQSANPYSYILNNPMSGTDPTGYASCSSDDVSGCVVDKIEKVAPTGSHIKTGRTFSGKTSDGGSFSFTAHKGASVVSMSVGGGQKNESKIAGDKKVNTQHVGTDTGSNIQDVDYGKKALDTYDSIGASDFLFGASTVGGAADLAFTGNSLVSTKGAATALFVTGSTMNEWATIRGASQTAGSFSLNSIGMAGQKIATLAGGAAFGMSFLQNYNFYVNNNISSSEFMGKTIFDFTALKMGSSSPYGLFGASLYGATDMMYKSNNLNYQKAPGVIQLKRDIVNKFNGRYNGFYESQKQVLPYNINPWSLYPRH